jgi:hypothetical protein
MQVPINAETPLATVRACLEPLGHTVGIARSLGFVCARTLDLPPEEGRAVRPELMGLRTEIDALTEALATRAPPPG